jgi:hypothetical protein
VRAVEEPHGADPSPASGVAMNMSTVPTRLLSSGGSNAGSGAVPGVMPVLTRPIGHSGDLSHPFDRSR